MKVLIFRTAVVKLSHSHSPFLCHHAIQSFASYEARERRNESSHAFSSSSSPSNFSPLPRRNYDEENRNVKVTVWWDFENCNIPGGVNVHCVANRITWAIRSSGIRGPITITAFGDVAQLSRATQEALTSTGICLTHVPHSGKNSSDRSFMADMVYWVSQNPPPAHFFLISGDKDFANILHRLRMSNYNILIASTEASSAVLYSAATLMWPWYGLVKGENVRVRHFNYPPDGLYGSWYGHHKGVLDDPFANADHRTTSQPEESMESFSVHKTRPVPKEVMKGICQIVQSYPEGISLPDLRNELKKSCITIDKDFYGHKKFSVFINSMNISKIRFSKAGDGQILVFSTLQKMAEQRDVSQSPLKETCANGMHNGNSFTFREGDSLLDKPSSSIEESSNLKGKNLDVNSSTTVLNMDDPSKIDLDSTSVIQPTTLDPSDVSQKSDSIAAKEGLIKKLWNGLTSHGFGSVFKKDDNILELDLSRHDSSTNALQVHSSDLSRLVKPKDETVDMKNLLAQKDSKEIGLVDAKKSTSTGSIPMQSDSPNYVSQQKVNYVVAFVKWCKSFIFGASDHSDNPESGDKEHQIDAVSTSGKSSPFLSTHSASHAFFSKPHFWDDLENFLLGPKGRQLILKSITREHLLQSLQNEGPSSLKELDNNQLSQLGDILILEKKWLEESASQKFPFKLVISAKNQCDRPQPLVSNGLSSLFSNKQLFQVQPSSEMPIAANAPHNFTELKLWIQKNFNSGGPIQSDELQKLFKDKFNRNLCSSIYGYSDIQSLIAAIFADATKSGPPSRERILSDCGKLLKELLKKNPTGFGICIFPTEFLQKYGYILDYKTLGYPKVSKLLEIFPGIKVESSFIRPFKEHPLDVSKDEGIAENGDVDDSVWDELGPLHNSSKHENAKDDKTDKEPIFRPVSLSDEEFTDSDEDTSVLSDNVSNSKQCMENGSLLLKILDSWDDNRADGWSNSNRKEPFNVGTTGSSKLRLKTAPQRFSFASNDGDDKESVAQSILGEVKRAGDLKKKELSK